MKLHDLRPAPGSHKKKTRVGRGIAAGQGKTAGRGTKGQKARAGGTIPAWFEGGQTPLHQRLPKLHGFRNPFRIEYEIVNIGDVARLVELGVLETGEMPGAKPAKAKAGAAPITVNQEILRAAGLVRTLDRPLKILGSGELSTALFVVADAFSASARTKIEAAGGTASVLETTGRKTPSIGLEPAASPAEATATAAPEADAADASGAEAEAADDAPAEAVAEPAVKPATMAKATAKAEAKAEAKPAAKAAAKPATKAAAAKADADATEKPKPAARKKAAPADAPDEPGTPA